MKNEKIKENLNNLRSIQTHTWNALLVTAGGSLTLIQTINKPLNKILAIAGFLFFAFLLNVYLNRNELINKLTNKLEE